MADIQLKITPLNPAVWQLGESDGPLPLQQHPVYALALESLGYSCLQINIVEGDTLLGYAVLTKKRLYGVIRWTNLFRGPVWLRNTASETTKRDALKKLQKLYNKWRWDFLTIMPEMPVGEAATKAMKQAGYRRVMTGFSTIWLDLTKGRKQLRADLNGKWRNQLVKAEKSGLSISLGGKKPHQYAWLLEKEQSQQGKKDYTALPVGFVEKFAAATTQKSGTSILSVTALEGREKVAGALFLKHGNSATYHIGWSGDKARQSGAQNLVLWQAVTRLKEDGIKYLDLGGLNTAELAGVARFKLGLGAEPITLAGGFA